MHIKTLTWNIGGGNILEPGLDPTLISSYSQNGLKDIIHFIREENPDIITLQETHKNSKYDQVEQIATELEYPFFTHDSTSHSHINPSMQLGHATISRYPITNHSTGFFMNLKKQVLWEDGSVATSFDKGYTHCNITIQNIVVGITNLHLTPFRRFNIELNSDEAVKILSDVSSKTLRNIDKWIMQGDFNIDSPTLHTYLPLLFKNGMHELPLYQPTTPSGLMYDHILYKGLELIEQKIHTNILTDHFPITSIFTIR